jgi:hypothetical protein
VVKARKISWTLRHRRLPFVRFGLPYERSGYIISPHTSTSFDPRHWTNPQQFDPGRYRDVPTSAQVDEAKSKQIGSPSARLTSRR